MSGPPPTLRLERSLLREGHETLACIDEVGRGALAGPVSVGIAVVSTATRSAPRGLRDSKLLSAQARQELLPTLIKWPLSHAVGHASPLEIDAVGILAALRIAAARAFSSLVVRPRMALLDGNHNWLAVPDPALFPDPRAACAEHLADLTVLPSITRLRIKADQTCAGVAAASVLAKCERDSIMISLSPHYPQYAWAKNKGYSSADHIAALQEHGASEMHRRSWQLPGVGSRPGSDPANLDLRADPVEATSQPFSTAIS